MVSRAAAVSIITEVVVPGRVRIPTAVAAPVAKVLVITKLLVPNMAAGIGVNSRISQNFVQQIETEDVPCQLGLPELVVVQLGHHLAGIAVHVNGNFAVLQSREKMVEITLILEQVSPYSSSLHSRVSDGGQM